MSGLKIVSQRRDSIDIDNVEGLKVDPGYALITERLRKTLDASTADLKRAGSWEEAKRLQGEIRAIETVLGMPDALVAEIKAKLKQEKR